MTGRGTPPDAGWLQGVKAAEDLFDAMWASGDWSGQVSIGFAATFSQELDRLREAATASESLATPPLGDPDGLGVPQGGSGGADDSGGADGSEESAWPVLPYCHAGRHDQCDRCGCWCHQDPTGPLVDFEPVDGPRGLERDSAGGDQ